MSQNNLGKKSKPGIKMKHPSTSLEAFEFNLGNAPQLRCLNHQQTTLCGSCESCILTSKLKPVREWFARAGDQTQRRFALGLIRRINSVDLIKHVVNLLQPLLCKDFTYSRVRVNPSLNTDRATMSSDRALDPIKLEDDIAQTWFWFQNSNYWTKSNFLMGILHSCEAHLLYQIGMQAKTALLSEQKAQVIKEDYETSSVASTAYTYNTDDRPELDLLTRASSSYTQIKSHPLHLSDASISSSGGGGGGKASQQLAGGRDTLSSSAAMTVDGIINDDSGDESFPGTSDLDPTCMVLPSSSKAHAGVTRYKDFIRCLPVNISKMILGYLDTVSLYNAVCVSKAWRPLVEEVHNEYYINQHLQEEVMLMQGAASQGCNPFYAKDVDVAVPNLLPNSYEVIRMDDGRPPTATTTTFKTEASFETAYSGCSTRNIIMEERNVYCGAYNVMVIVDQVDVSRVVDTNGGKLIAVGGQDRKVRLINADTTREEEPQISGHAGSVRCVTLCEKRGFLLSGSYDTSIRKWSVETGKCMKILRGHRDTITCMQVWDNQLVSGAKDNMCKVWNLESGKCLATFKHRHAVSAVAMSDEMCLSGCEGGKVKVWELKSGELIKCLIGHHGAVTCISFDTWHIITGSRDGYAMVWSAQGNHKRCLTALRHPKEVLCCAYTYLRLVTGSADGKLRIWNIVTGQCLRIMRGNSRSDPILQLIALGNRITINTCNNMLVYNFEPVDYDYTLPTDKMPPKVQYGKYSDAPIHQQMYPYVRAQRMVKAGATNQKIIHHSEEGKARSTAVAPSGYARSDQTLHSAKSLSHKSMKQAKRLQSAATTTAAGGSTGKGKRSVRVNTAQSSPGRLQSKSMCDLSTTTSPPQTTSTLKAQQPSRPTTAKSRTAAGSMAGTVFEQDHHELDSDMIIDEQGELKRRVSWAFEHPFTQNGKVMNLADTKSLLRSQIRAKGEVIPPDFVYLTVNNIQQSMKPSEITKNMEINRRLHELQLNKKFGRPSSSPSRIDPRTKVPLDEMSWDQFLSKQGYAKDPAMSEIESEQSYSSGTSAMLVPTTTTILTEFGPVPVDAKPHLSMHSNKLKSSIPPANLLRPHTATVIKSPSHYGRPPPVRPQSAAVLRPNTAGTTTRTTRSGNKSAQSRGQSSKLQSASFSQQAPLPPTGSPVPMTPMLMYSPNVQDKIAEMKQRRVERLAEQQFKPTATGQGDQLIMGNVSQYNNPMRSHMDFKLKTHQQVEQEMKEMNEAYVKDRQKKASKIEKKQKAAWIAKVTGKTDKDFARRPKSIAPELGELGEFSTVS